MDFIVLGATGIQGRIVSRDLLETGYSVYLCGWKRTGDKKIVEHLLKKYKNRTRFEYIEAREIWTVENAIRKSKANVVINCMEGDWNYEVFKVCLKLKVHCIDLGSEIPVTKKQFSLDKAMRKNKLIAITGIGSVPGIGNIMLRYAADKLDEIHSISLGFAWNSNIKDFVVPFSMESIFEEFTDPAPVVENKKYKYKVPLENVHKRKHRYIGVTNDMFVRHPEEYTFMKYFKNKGLRNIKFYAGFPEHSFDMIVKLIKIGFASKVPINYFGIKIKPIDFITQMLRDYLIPKGYTEKENLWLVIKGVKSNKKKEIKMECLVPPVKGWESAGCNIDTGFPASILAQMVKKGKIKTYGSYSPEIGIDPVEFFKELRKKKLKIYENGRLIN